MTKENVKNCKVYSKANYPVTIKYDGKEHIIAPFARGVEFADVNKLECQSDKVRIIKG